MKQNKLDAIYYVYTFPVCRDHIKKITQE